MDEHRVAFNEFRYAFSEVDVPADDLSAEQTARAANAAAIDEAGWLRDARGRPLSRVKGYPDAEAVAALYWPFQEKSAAEGVTGLNGAIQGGSSLNRWGSAPGMMFNGSNNRVVTTGGLLGGFTATAKLIMDLASLTSDEMLVAWAVNTHPASIPQDSTILSCGMNADPAGKGGWAIGLKSSSGKPTFAIRARGGTSTSQITIGTSGARGVGSDNTCTATAWEITKSKIAGLLEVRGYQLTLNVDGGNAQSNVGLDTIAAVPNGTGPVTADVSTPIMLGAWCDTSTSTYTNLMGAGMAMCNVGIMRRPLDLGIGMRICRDLRAMGYPYKQFPMSARG